jgi:hypothetical protein
MISTLALAGTLAIASSALANSGTLLPLDQYQAGTEVTNNTIVQNGGFESVDGLGEPNNWAKVGTFQVGTPIGANVSAANGSKAAQGPVSATLTDDTGAPNKYIQTITLAPNTNYYISAYLWNFTQNWDLTVAEVLDPASIDPQVPGSGIVRTVSLTRNENAANTGTPPLIDGSRGVFAYKTFNSNIFASSTTIQVEVEFDIDTTFGAHGVPLIAGQIDNVSITPASQFVAPSAVPEPASLSLLAVGAAGLLRRRRI